MKFLIGFLLILFVTTCTDARKAQLSSYGDSAQVICYSGGIKIFESQSTGYVQGLEGGGWIFQTIDNKFVKTYADCFVIQQQ